MSIKARIPLYIAVICAIFLPWMAWETDRNMVRRWLYPATAQLAVASTRCDGAAPSWLQELARQLPISLDSPANQLAFVDKAGAQSGCVNGWEGYPLLSARVTADTRFRLASLSKVVTFFGVVHEEARGQAPWLDRSLIEVLSFERPLRDPRMAQVRIRHLLDHSAGFDRLKVGDPMAFDNRKPWCPSEMEQLAQTALQFSPGARHAYANLGYCLAAVAYEHHAGQSLWHALEQEMHVSRYGIDYLDQADSPVAYSFMHHERHGPDFVDLLDWQALRASMGMTGNARGLARFVADNRDLLSFARGMHDATASCNEDLPNNCMDGVLEHFRGEGAQYWLQRGYLYGMSALFVVDEPGNFLVWLGAGDLRQPLPTQEFVRKAFARGVS